VLLAVWDWHLTSDRENDMGACRGENGSVMAWK